MRCPNDNELAAFAQGLADPCASARVRTHALGCTSCQEVLDELAECGGPTRPDTMRGVTVLAAGDQVGRYRIRGLIGRGSMGLVYRARDPALRRDIAIKVLPPGSTLSGGARREARALARLTHAHVLTVLDIGLHGGAAYVATELIDGPTLDGWLQARRRSASEIVRVGCEIADALSAAHRVGIVHRDVKPANIFMGSDGCTRLGDFGLAHLAKGLSTVAPGTPGQHGATRATRLVGTPRFMAPEQLEGRPAEPRSDQFALCVTLYLALYQCPPFPGNDFETLRENVLAGRMCDPPVRADVRPSVRAAIVRGFATDPEDRHPSMEDLRLALIGSSDAARSRRVKLGGLAIFAAATWLAWEDPSKAPCENSAAALGDTWSPRRRADVERSFGRATQSFAGIARSETLAAFDDFEGRWVSEYERACEFPSPARRFDATLACLFRQRAQAAAISSMLSTVDSSLVAQASAMVAKVPDPADCSDARALSGDPSEREHIAELNHELAELSALHGAGAYQRGLERARALRVKARELNHLPTTAEVLLEVAAFERAVGDLRAAEGSCKDALLAAESGDRADLAVKALACLVFVVGAEQHQPERGLLFARQAQAMLSRVGDRPGLAIVLHEAIGAMSVRSGEYERGEEAYRSVLAISIEQHGSDSIPVAQAYADLGALAAARGDYAPAVEHLEAALALYERHLGADHPEIADVAGNLGAMHRELGNYEQALADLERALRIRISTVGPDSPLTGVVLSTLGNLHLAQNEYARAVELHQRALAIYERDPEANAGSIALTLNSLGGAHRGLGHEDDALDYFQRALDLRSRTLGAEHVLVAQTENNVARALMDRGRAERATELLAHALPALERAYPPAHPTVLIAMNSLGEAQRRSGRLDDAEATFRRALAIHHNHETRASSQAVTVIGLGQTAQDAGDPASAVRWFEQSLRLLEHDSSDERRTRTHDLLQRAKAQLGAKR